MSLDDMTVETTVHDQASFQVDEMAGLPVAEIGLAESLFDRGNLMNAILGRFDGETGAVVGNTLVGLQFLGNGGCDPEYFVTSLIIN